MKEAEAKAAVIMTEQLHGASNMLGSAFLVASNGSPWPREAMTHQCARLSAAINIMVRLGMIDFELHDALAERDVFDLAAAKGIKFDDQKEG